MGLRARDGAHQVFHDQSLLIVDPSGAAGGGVLSGFFYANTRVLCRFALRVNDQPPFPVQVHPARDDLLVAYYQDPHVTRDAWLQDRALLLQLTAVVGGGFHLDLDARNHSLGQVSFDLSLGLEADFADLEEARQAPDASKILRPDEAGETRRRQQAPVSRRCSLESDRELRFDYLHPQLEEGVVLRFSEAPRCVDGGVAWRLDLEPQGAWHACIDISPIHEGIRPVLTARCYGGEDDGARTVSWMDTATRLETTNDGVRRSYERAVSDLAALALRRGPPAEQAAFAAGIPIYHNAFGRDLLTTAWQALLASPVLLESAILVCERYQDSIRDDFRDEQPGRIIQQVRSGPLNLLNINPRERYYSDYASPGDLLVMLGQHFMWTGDREFLRARLPATRRALDWFDWDADLDGDGFYEYQTRSPQGDRNQGWKDSEHAVPHEDGSDAPLPIATCEVQAYVVGQFDRWCRIQTDPLPRRTSTPASSSSARRCWRSARSRRVSVCCARRRRCASGSIAPSGCPIWAASRWRWTGRSGRCARSPPTRGTAWRRASSRRSTRRRSPGA